jgi:hypothetical protein
MPNMAHQTVTEKVTVYVPVQKVVDGKTVIENVPQERTVMRAVQRAVGWRTLSVPVDGESVFVYDLKGKNVAPNGLAKLLDEETPVLLSTSGKVDPFYLKTTKAGTLIVVVPPERFYQVPKSLVPPPRPALPVDKEKVPPPPPPGR